jgi:hypothetical protein
MTELRMPEHVYGKQGELVAFNQLAVKIKMDGVDNDAYFGWLDRITDAIGRQVQGAQIAEKPSARTQPPLNTAIYYDTTNYRILPTGALLRTSCNKITHAFCAFKDVEDAHGVRNDNRYVFDGEEKRTIQAAPASEAAVSIVKRLLRRKDIVHPGTRLRERHGIDPEALAPAIMLESLRFTFFAWLDGQDALRCSIDRYQVSNLRLRAEDRTKKPLSEVELAIYPRIGPTIAADKRVVLLIETLRDSLCREFGVSSTKHIKYQRSATALGIGEIAEA